MIGKLKGRVVQKTDEKLCIDVGGITYEISIPRFISARLSTVLGQELSIVVYHYLHLDKNRYIPVMIGFLDELERDFFEIFISVSGIGPRAAVKALDKPPAVIAQAIEEGNVGFLRGLAGIGKQKARQIIAQLQGKVGRFALLRVAAQERKEVVHDKEVIEEAKQILRRLQYSAKEIETMIKKALSHGTPFETVESLLNEIYRSRMH